MKQTFRSIIALLLLLAVLLTDLVACKPDNGDNTPAAPEHVDYVANLKLDMNSETKKQEVTLKSHIDGDTSHFRVPTTFDTTGVVKGRYLAINTPESTGRVEEWGKAASKFTEERLTTAYKIIIESDKEVKDGQPWSKDGNGRYLVWVWYQPSEGAEFRNLNLEILQEGLAVGSSPSSNRYGEYCVNAIAQATREKLYIFSNDKDPQYPYGEAQSVTLKELRTNINEYDGARVAFEGVITYNSDWTAYVEDYDAETDTYFGIQLFYGYNSNLISPLAQGNRVRVVGTVGNHFGTWQIASLNYNAMKPKDPANTSVLSKGNEIAFKEVTADKFLNGEVTIQVDDETTKTLTYKEIAVSTAISMKNLTVTKVSTTQSNTDSNGAMTLTCSAIGSDGKTYTITVRTEVLKDENGDKITASYFNGKTIDVKGIVEYYIPENAEVGKYQIKLYSVDDVVIH